MCVEANGLSIGDVDQRLYVDRSRETAYNEAALQETERAISELIAQADVQKTVEDINKILASGYFIVSRSRNEGTNNLFTMFPWGVDAVPDRFVTRDTGYAESIAQKQDELIRKLTDKCVEVVKMERNTYRNPIRLQQLVSGFESTHGRYGGLSDIASHIAMFHDSKQDLTPRGNSHLFSEAIDRQLTTKVGNTESDPIRRFNDPNTHYDFVASLFMDENNTSVNPWVDLVERSGIDKVNNLEQIINLPSRIENIKAWLENVNDSTLKESLMMEHVRLFARKISECGYATLGQIDSSNSETAQTRQEKYKGLHDIVIQAVDRHIMVTEMTNSGIVRLINLLNEYNKYNPSSPQQSN